MTELRSYRDLYQRTLLDDVIPFWERHAPDRQYGGFFTCLDRDGSVYDTEKFMWMQWRIVWMLAELCHCLEPRDSWRRLAEDGYRFLTQHGRDPAGRYYFALRRDGSPTMAPYSIYSDAFAAMACAALYRITRDSAVKAEALRAWNTYLAREARPKAEWTKELPGRRPMRSLGFFMMKLNLQLVLEECLGGVSSSQDIENTVETIFGAFWNPERRLLFESVPAEGGFDLESMIGRQLNPGHAAETVWFILRAAEKLGRADWIPKACEMLLADFDLGWDREYGGIFYFCDACGKPPMELTWDMKLWWVHNEALIAAALAHRLTGRTEFVEWFQKIHDWAWTHFPDPAYGEWFGYLNRRGEPTHLLKGGKWKTFFHLPRMLLTCTELFSSAG